MVSACGSCRISPKRNSDPPPFRSESYCRIRHAPKNQREIRLCSFQCASHIRRMDKEQVAQILVEIGTLLELKGENPFKTRAYQNGARVIESLSEPLAKVVEHKRLGEIKGIGDALQQKITELVTTGKLKYYEDLKASIPPGMIAMLEISGLGPKRILILQKKLGIESVEALDKACKDGKIAELEGFGEKSQKNFLEAIERRRTYASK